MNYIFVSILNDEETAFESEDDLSAVSYCEYLLKKFNSDEGILMNSLNTVIEVW